MKIVVLFLWIPFLSFSQQKKYNYTNLVLEGGGVRGLAYAGVFSVLEEKNILPQIEKVAGSSAGAIAGMLLSVGYSVTEIDSIMLQLPIQQFNDGKGGYYGKYRRVKKHFGIYKGEKFENWLKLLVRDKTGNQNLSFMQLHQLHLKNVIFKDLYCTGTNLSKQQLEVFSYEKTPDMPIALAVRISGSIPIYFEPIALDNNKNRIIEPDDNNFINYFVDGGMLCNYPIGMFDSCAANENPLFSNHAIFNQQTLGIKLERDEQVDSLQKNKITIPPYNVKNFNEYVTAFSNLLMETLSRKYPNLENELDRTIYVSDGNLSAIPRKMKPQQKKLLFDNGVKAATAFFKK